MDRSVQDPAGSQAGSVRTAALAYAARGWPVFPVKPNKKPLTAHGFLDATTDTKQIETWWDQWPDAGIGVPTGPSTFMVLDIDPRNDGYQSLEHLIAEHGPLPSTMHSYTGGGGEHYFFRCPPGTACKNGALPGIDIKAEGGYAVVPPSAHESGRIYEWELSSGPDEVELAPFPLQLPLRVGAGNLAGFVPDELLDEGCAERGERNDKLTRLAGRWIHEGHSLLDVQAKALEWNDKNPEPLSNAEVRRTCESVWRTDARRRGVGAEAADDWPEPVPLYGDGEGAPAFPLKSAFPESLAPVRDYMAAVAETYQVPVDLPTMLMPPVVATAAAQKFEIQLAPDWREVSAIWTLTLLPSGARKSPVFQEIIAPVYQWERDELDRRGGEIRVAQEERAVRQMRIDGLRRKAAGDGQEAEDARKELLRLAAEPEPPPIVLPRLVTTETTTEALARTMAQSAERALVASPESDALETLLTRYSSEPNFGLWLKGYTGEPIRVDRRGRESDCLDHPVLNIALTCQPEGARDMFGSRKARGRGLLARFLTISPRSLVGERRIEPASIPEDLRQDFRRRVRRLLDLDLPAELQPTILGLDPEARELFLGFCTRLETRLGTNGDLADHCEWGSKLAGNLARIAMVLHLLAEGNIVNSVNSVRGVPAETMLAALAWEPYLVAHQRLTQRTVSADPDLEMAAKVLRWVRKKDLEEFSHRDAYRACGQTAEVGSMDKFTPSLVVLEDHGWIRSMDIQRSGRGRSAATRYRVHPSLVTPDTIDRIDGNPRPSPGGSDG